MSNTYVKVKLYLNDGGTEMVDVPTALYKQVAKTVKHRLISPAVRDAFIRGQEIDLGAYETELEAAVAYSIANDALDAAEPDSRHPSRSVASEFDRTKYA